VHDRFDDNGADGFERKSGCCPHFIEPVKLVRPHIRVFAQLPEWIDDVESIFREDVRKALERRFNLVSVETEYVEVGTKLLYQATVEFPPDIGIIATRSIDVSNTHWYSNCS
jgi:hypothetical protein